ncbi:MAG: nucleotidyltransferase domain-containing protein [Pirellulales bacterium]
MKIAYNDYPEICTDYRLKAQVQEHPYPLVFATISGAHLYGFPSANSDFDLRGIHVLPLSEVVGLKTGSSTIERSGIVDDWEIDLVTHDLHKFFTLIVRPNGYVLEQILSPLVVYASPNFEELKSIAIRCVTKHHAHHYLGFAATQWKLLEKEAVPRIKPLLYLYRVLLTGIYLMQTGQIQANLIRLNEHFKLSWIEELIERKIAGVEKEKLDESTMPFHQRQYERLTKLLREAHECTHLPETATGKEALHDLLLRIRLAERADT